MTIINPRFAALAAELFENTTVTIASYWDTYEEDLRGFNFVRVELYTGDGRSAVFYEEGIEFYPETPKTPVEITQADLALAWENGKVAGASSGSAYEPVNPYVEDKNETGDAS